MPRLAAALALVGSLCACTDGSSPMLTPSLNPPILSEIEAPRELFGGEARAFWMPQGTITDSAWILIEVEGTVSFSRNELCWTEEFKGYCGNPALSWLETEAHGPVGAGAPVRISVLKPGQQPGGNSGTSLYSPTGSANSPVGRYLFRNTGGAQSLWTRRFEANPEVGSPTFPHIGYFPMFNVTGNSRVSVKKVPTPLRVDGPTTVQPRETATFTAQPVGDFRIRDAQGRTDVYWQYVPGDTMETPDPSAGRFWISCDKIECQYAPGQSGRLVAHTYVEGQPISRASQVIRVQDKSTDPVLNVVCTLSGRQRGATVTCTPIVTPETEMTVLRRLADGSGFEIRESAPSGPAQWSGTAVASTTVTFIVRVPHNGGTKQLRASASFTVQPRNWGPYQLTQPPEAVIATRGMEDYPDDSKLGNFSPHPLSPYGTPVDSVSTGPNAGLMYYTQRPPYHTTGATVATHPGLYPPGQRVWTHPDHGKWYNDQNGRPGGTCSTAHLPRLRQEVDRHEGLTQAATSHYGVLNRAFLAHRPDETLEELYVFRAPSVSLHRRAYRLYAAFLTGPAHSMQEAFDSVDRPAIFSSFPCSFDMNPRDN